MSNPAKSLFWVSIAVLIASILNLIQMNEINGIKRDMEKVEYQINHCVLSVNGKNPFYPDSAFMVWHTLDNKTALFCNEFKN